MKTLEWQSHRTNAPRPTEVVGVDYGRNTLRGLPAPTTRIAYTMSAVQDSLYDADTDSYLVAGSVGSQVRVARLSTTAQTTIETYPANTRVSFTRVGAWVCVTASERGNSYNAYILLLHLQSGQVVRVDRAPDVSGSRYQSQSLVWTLTSAQNVQGVQVIWNTDTVYLNVTNNDNTWQVDLLPDANDPLPTLREVIGIEIDASYIEAASGRWAKAQILNSYGSVLTEQLLVEGKNYIDLTRLPNYAEQVSAIRIVRYGGDVELSRTVWFHTLRRQYMLVQGYRPEVGNLSDNQLTLSEPLYLTPTQTVLGVRHSFSNVGNSYDLWVYRLDSVGVYRLVAKLAPNQTVVDDRLEWELGEPFSDTLYPVQSSGLALEWDARAVIADGNDLWISTAGDFAWDDDAERLTFEERIIALAVWRNLLCVGLESGWRVLVGVPNSFSVQRVSDAPPVTGYRGYGALAFADGSILLGDSLYTDNLAEWRRYLRLGRYTLLLAPDHLLLAYEGRWVRVNITASNAWLRSGQIELHTPTGIQTLSGTRQAWSYSVPLLFETRANLKSLYLDGTGKLTSVRINAQSYNDIALPAYIDRIRVEEWYTTLEIVGQADAEVYRIVMDFEPAKPR